MKLMPLVIQSKACQAFSPFSPLFTQLEKTERTDEAETGGEIEMSGRDRSGMREKMTLLNLNEKSLTELVPLLDLP